MTNSIHWQRQAPVEWMFWMIWARYRCECGCRLPFRFSSAVLNNRRHTEMIVECRRLNTMLELMHRFIGLEICCMLSSDENKRHIRIGKIDDVTNTFHIWELMEGIEWHFPFLCLCFAVWLISRVWVGVSLCEMAKLKVPFSSVRRWILLFQLKEKEKKNMLFRRNHWGLTTAITNKDNGTEIDSKKINRTRCLLPMSL